MGTEAKRSAVESSVARLTPREEQVLHRVLLGETNKEIAACLGCSDKAVEYHVRNILKKMQMPTRMKLLASRIIG
jgi:DNA-binding NarL/FixJ family response regulator